MMYEKISKSRCEWVPNAVFISYGQWSAEVALMVLIPGVMSQNCDFTITEGGK